MYSPDTSPDAHRFWYARIIGVFHADVLDIGPQSRNRGWQRMEVLWVRWMGLQPGYRFGHKLARLPKIGFVPDTDPYAFGFLDPNVVLRGCHLIPAFTHGRTRDLLNTDQPTAARAPGETDDWTNYYVNM